MGNDSPQVGAVDREAGDRPRVGPLTRRPDQAGESTLGAVVADAVQVGAKTFCLNVATLIDPRQLHGDLRRRDHRDGTTEITVAAALRALPLGEMTTTVNLTGAQLHQALEEQLERRPPMILQPSQQLSYHHSPATPAGSRVDPASITIGGAVVDPARTYRISVSDTLRGRGGLPAPQTAPPIPNGSAGGAGNGTLFDLLAAYLSTRNPAARARGRPRRPERTMTDQHQHKPGEGGRLSPDEVRRLRSRRGFLAAAGGVAGALALEGTAAAAPRPAGELGESRLRLHILSDVHISDDYPMAINDMRVMLQDLQSAYPDPDPMVIIIGDLTEFGQAQDYSLLDLALHTSPHPDWVLHAIGNHEYMSNTSPVAYGVGELVLRGAGLASGLARRPARSGSGRRRWPAARPRPIGRRPVWPPQGSYTTGPTTGRTPHRHPGRSLYV